MVFLILDSADAFFILPLLPAERRFFVVQFNSKYYVFLVLAQGAKLRPLVWGRFISLAWRLTQCSVQAECASRSSWRTR